MSCSTTSRGFVATTSSLVLTVVFDADSGFREPFVEPTVDGQYTNDNAVDLLELFAYLSAAPAKLVSDVNDLLDGRLGSLGPRTTSLTGLLATQELSDA